MVCARSSAVLLVAGSDLIWYACAYQGTIASQPWQLWSATDDGRAEGNRLGRRASPRRRRLLRQNGISVVRTRKHKVTTDSNHKFNIAPNLLDRDFTANAPNQKWAGDISYVWTREGWLYLAVILDLNPGAVSVGQLAIE